MRKGHLARSVLEEGRTETLLAIAVSWFLFTLQNIASSKLEGLQHTCNPRFSQMKEKRVGLKRP